MSTESYWRGYIDSQSGKTNYLIVERFAWSHRRKILEPLAELLGTHVEESRTGYVVRLGKGWEKTLPQKLDADYARGWFLAKGKRYKDPLKLTVTGLDLDPFLGIIKDTLKVELPKPQKPSATSQIYRVIITGDKARQVNKFLKGA